MKLTILRKILLLTGLVIICVVTGLVTAAGMLVSEGFEQEMTARVETMSRTASYALKQRFAVADDHLGRFAATDDSVAALLTGDDTPLGRMAEQSVVRDGLSALVILDAKGKQLGRAATKEASGFAIPTAMLDAEGGGLTRLGDGLLYHVRILPVMNGGERIGTFAGGVLLDANNALVDEIKELTGCEATLFNGKTRAATTLEKDGKRAAGTVLDNPAVLDLVLGLGQTFMAGNVIFGEPYAASYSPLRDMRSNPTGMLFIGLPKKPMLESLRKVQLALAGLGLAIGVCFMALAAHFSKRITRPIVKATNFAKALSEGELDRGIETRARDEAGTLVAALRVMAVNLKSTLHEAHLNALECQEEAGKARQATLEAEAARIEALNSRREGMLEAAGRISDIAASLEEISGSISVQVEQSFKGAHIQKDRIASMAAAMEELSATIGEVAANAEASAKASQDASSQAHEGASVVRKLSGEMNTVREQSLTLRESMRALDQAVAAIGTVVGTISDIADQTNLLALNAAIEAARAGESGRGFAVVADEVRKLAEKTMAATRQVGESIESIQQNARANAGNVSLTVEAVERVGGLASSSAEVLEAIVATAEKASGQAHAIADASRQQSAASEEINQAIEEVNTVSAETAGSMTHASKTIAELAAQTHGLTLLVASLLHHGKEEYDTGFRARPGAVANQFQAVIEQERVGPWMQEVLPPWANALAR
jgi:methyl-accepting chemotaxis protein